MKAIKVLLKALMLISICLGSCAIGQHASYLPNAQEVGLGTKGVYILVNLLENQEGKRRVSGELIAVQNNVLYILTEPSSRDKFMVLIDAKNVRAYKFQYARARNLSWTIPVSSLATIPHGWYATLTLPINLIVTSAISLNSSKAYTVNGNKISLTELGNFARFPQGIPEGVELKQIK